MTLPPLTRDVVLIGGGHAHALFLRRWGMRPVPGARLTLITPEPTAPYTGMLPGYVAGHYDRAALEIDMIRLARFAGARIILAKATGIDQIGQEITVHGRPAIPYDIASVDIGITGDMPDLPGFDARAIPAKPLGPFAQRWDAFVTDVIAGRQNADIAIIGGGVAGVELALAMAYRLRDCAPRLTIIEREDRILRHSSPAAQSVLIHHLNRAGVAIRTGVQIERIDDGRICFAQGPHLPAGFVTGTATARPADWLVETGLHLTNGFITVDEYLRSITAATLYAVGDIAHMHATPREKAGVFAVRQAPVLYHNIRADLIGAQRRRYSPQKDYLKLISTGGKSAVADKFGRAVQGPMLWRWKDRIDAKFMTQFEQLKPMPMPSLPKDAAKGMQEVQGDKPICGGCGAKVGAGALTSALSKISPHPNAAIIQGIGDDAGVVRQPDGQLQVLSTDHFRAFVEDPYMMGRIAVIHALGDIWAMGAVPQTALVNVTLPRMTPKMESSTLREIITAANETLCSTGATLIGGHSSIGVELTVGVTATGWADNIVRKTGAQDGAALILTKPIGTGVLLAGDMQLKSHGPDIAATLDQMTLASDTAAAILAPLATAMTDITGFGLIGHMLEMLNHGLCAQIDLSNVPILPGATALAQAGIRSSLYAANAEQRQHIVINPAVTDDPRIDLLFDPQTAGGLLAAIPQTAVKEVLARLGQAGYTAACIGQVQTDDTARVRIM